MAIRSVEYLQSLVRELAKLPDETEWVEFKGYIPVGSSALASNLPVVILYNAFPFFTFHPLGISPNHSTPESFISLLISILPKQHFHTALSTLNGDDGGFVVQGQTVEEIEKLPFR